MYAIPPAAQRWRIADGAQRQRLLRQPLRAATSPWLRQREDRVGLLLCAPAFAWDHGAGGVETGSGGVALAGLASGRSCPYLCG